MAGGDEVNRVIGRSGDFAIGRKTFDRSIAQLLDHSIPKSLRLFWLRTLISHFFHIRGPGVRICRGRGIDAEGPEVEVHALRSLHFDDGVFAGGEVFGGSQLEPASGDAVDGGLDGSLFGSGFAAGGAFEIADNAFAAFHFQMNDDETIEGNDGLLGLLRLGGLGTGSVKTGLGRLSGSSLAGRRLWGGRFVFGVNVNGRNGDVSIDGGVLAIEFDGLLGAGGGNDRAAENAGFGAAIDITLVLLNLDELGLALEIVE